MSRSDAHAHEGADRSAETTAAGLPWVAFARCRSSFRDRWPSIFRLRLMRDLFELPERAGLPIRTVLDVGATDRVHEARVRSAWPGVDYRSLDIDRTNRHDYHDFAEVDREFDLVTLLEVVEHLAPKDAVDLVHQCHRACRSGGYMLASVPNVWTPGVQQEWTHVATLQYIDLIGLLAWTGFEIVDAARVYFGRGRHWWVHTKLLHPLHRLLQVDYAQSIVVLGRKR
jgi:predicted SAM-dependent methyltransferase